MARLWAETKRALRGMKCGKAVGRERALRGMKCGKAVGRDKESTERDEVWQGCGQRQREH